MNQYRPQHRELQDRHDTRRLADRLAEGTSKVISDELRSFIQARTCSSSPPPMRTDSLSVRIKGADPAGLGGEITDPHVRLLVSGG